MRYLLRESPDYAYVRRRKGDAWGNGRDEVLLDSSSIIRTEVHAALILEKEGLAKGTRVQLLGRTALPCTFADLQEAGLGVPRLEGPTLVKNEIVGQVRFMYAGREIGKERQPLAGALLREAIVTLFLSGRLFSNLGERLIERINAYNLSLAMEGGTTTLEPHAWLVSHLSDLGVEAAQDWLLLSPEDFSFTLIDEATFAKINESYPQAFSMNGAKFRVQYEPRERRVTLEWTGGVRQPQLSSWMLPRWEGWSVQVDIRGQLKTLR